MGAYKRRIFSWQDLFQVKLSISLKGTKKGERILSPLNFINWNYLIPNAVLACASFGSI
jgi:hypothetical protein